MSNMIYRFTRQLAIILSITASILLTRQGLFVRALGNIILLLMFIITSHLYQKRFNLISTSYLFIFIIIYIVFSLVSSYFDCEKIIELDSTGFQDWETNDFYPIYFWSIFFSYIVIIFYLKFICKTRNVRPTAIFLNAKQVRNMYIGIIFTAIAYYMLGKKDELILPGLALIVIFIVIDKPRRILHIMAFCISLVLFRSIFLARFYVIQIVFPAIIAYVMKSKKNEKKYPIIKLYFGFGVLFIGIMLYGVISEIRKINSMSGGQYDLPSVFRSGNELLTFNIRQLYRLFVVWIKNGGYIIYHVGKNGYYFGLSYIDSISGLLGIPTISLPEIAATYNYSTYSQTGLVAEGFANFGIIGATINILMVFFFMEFLRNRFVHQSSLMTMAFMAVPFTKVLFDGGSLTSCIVLCFVLLIINVLNVFSGTVKQADEVLI